MQVGDVTVTLVSSHGSGHLNTSWKPEFYWCISTQMFFSTKLPRLLIPWSSRGAETRHLGVNGSTLIDRQGEREAINTFPGRQGNSPALQLSEERNNRHLCILAQLALRLHYVEELLFQSQWLNVRSRSFNFAGKGEDEVSSCCKKKQRKNHKMASFRPNSHGRLEMVLVGAARGQKWMQRS